MFRIVQSRIFVRLVASMSILIFGILILLNIIDPDPKAVEEFQKSNIVIESFSVILSLLGPISVGVFWVLMLYHWGTTQFKSSIQKKTWLVLMTLGNIGGAFAYYFLVFELQMGLRKETSSVQVDFNKA